MNLEQKYKENNKTFLKGQSKVCKLQENVL